MSLTQTDIDRDMALQDTWMACIARRLSFWVTWCNGRPEALRYGVSRIAWDDPRPEPAVLEWQPCASYEEAVERATALNTALVAGEGR